MKQEANGGRESISIRQKEDNAGGNIVNHKNVLLIHPIPNITDKNVQSNSGATPEYNIRPTLTLTSPPPVEKEEKQ